MVSKNNRMKRMEQAAERRPHFGIRKLTIGAASVLLGTSLWMSVDASATHAEETDSNGNGDANQEQASSESTPQINNDTKVVVDANSNNNTQVSDNNSAKQDVAVDQNKAANVQVNKSATNNANTASVKSDVNATNNINATVDANNAQNSGVAQSNVSAAKNANDVTENINENNNAAQNNVNKTAKSATNNSSVNAAQEQNSIAKTAQDLTKSDIDNAADNGKIDKVVVEANGNLTDNKKTQEVDLSGVGAQGVSAAQAAKLFGTSLVQEQAEDATDADGFRTVNNFDDLQNAISNSSVKGVTINGDITANGDIAINHDITIKGFDKNATLNLGSHIINNNAHLTLDDITINGAVNGQGNVTIKGIVNSNVDNSTPTGTAAQQGFNNPTRTTSGAGLGEPGNPGTNTNTTLQDANAILINNYSRRKLPNFYAVNLTIDDNATLNIKRTVTGDGIVLKDGAVTDGIHAITQATNDGKLHVGKNGILTINLKNSNLSDDQINRQSKNASIDNLNAAVRVNTSGSFTSDANAKITINVGTGRGIVFSSRNMSFDAGASTNYITRGDPGMSGLDGKGNPVMTNWIDNNLGIKNVFRLGENNTFTFVGRDAFMLGNRATFHSGKNSVVNVHTYGLGNAIDIGTISSSDANDPNADFGLNVDEGSTVSFISDGKNRGGNYNQNNYVALGGGGQINVMKDATLRVILTGRGSSDLNDDINIASYDPKLSPKIYVGNNATLDVQSDATQGNAELIAIPLPASKEVNFILDNVKYVNLQKTAVSTGPILAPGMSEATRKAMDRLHLPYTANGYGNLIFMNAGNNQDAHFIAYGNLAAFKWNNKDLSSNNLQYDPNESVTKNYSRFENAAAQTWSNMYGFDIPYQGFSKGSANGDGIWVVPSGPTNGTNVNSNHGIAFSNIEKGFSPYMSQRLVIIGHSIQPVQNQRTVHYVVQDVDENGNPIETDPSQMREIADPYVQSAEGDNAQSQLLYKDNATDQLIQVERNADGTPKLDEHGAVIPVRDADGNYQIDGDNVNWKQGQGTIVKGADGHFYFQGYTAPETISGKDSNGNDVTALDGGLYKLATDEQLRGITNNSQLVRDGKISDSKDFANNTNEFKSGNFYNTYKDGNLYVVYRAVNEKAGLRIVDHTTNTVLDTYSDAGESNEAIDFGDDPSTAIQNYIKNGYVFEKAVNDADPEVELAGKDQGYKDINFGNFDNDTKTDQNFTIYLVHGIEDIDEAHPHDQVVSKTVTRNVKYTVDGQPSSQLPSKTESVKFSATGHWDTVLKKVVDVVNGKIVVENGQVKDGSLTWTPESGNLDGYEAPTLTGYHVDSVSATSNGQVVTADNVNNDGTVKTVSVDRNSHDIDVTVNLVKNADEKATVKIIDQTDNNKVLGTFTTDKGVAGEAISFNGEPETLSTLLNSGYEWVSAVNDNGNVSIGDRDSINFGTFDNDPNTDQSFTITLRHGQKVTYEDGTSTAKVHYVIAGNDANKPDAPKDSDPQTINWRRTVITDQVTGNITYGDWTIDGDQKKFTDVKSPDVTGYVPDKTNVNFDDPQVHKDQIVTVVYSKNPDVVQNADLVIYDSTDPNNVKPLNTFTNNGIAGSSISFSGAANYVGELISRGYTINHFENDNGDSSNPSSYDQITYGNFDNVNGNVQHFKLYLTAPTPETTTGKVTYIDDTTKSTLHSDNLSGNVGGNIDYTTQDKIQNYENMGYKLVSNNFTDGREVFNSDASKNNFEVHLVHDTVPVNPDNPGKPGDKINPNDPRDPKDQPKYPDGTTTDELTKDITRTIHYEGADQYTPGDVEQNVHFSAKGVLDKVTGEWTTPLTWSEDQNVKGVTSPKIPGYHVANVDKDSQDKQNVDD